MKTDVALFLSNCSKFTVCQQIENLCIWIINGNIKLGATNERVWENIIYFVCLDLNTIQTYEVAANEWLNYTMFGREESSP